MPQIFNSVPLLKVLKNVVATWSAGASLHSEVSMGTLQNY